MMTDYFQRFWDCIRMRGTRPGYLVGRRYPSIHPWPSEKAYPNTKRRSGRTLRERRLPIYSTRLNSEETLQCNRPGEQTRDEG